MTLGCYDGCGATVADDGAAMQAGWSFLVISTRWRCGPCGAALRRVVGITGGPGSTPDTLPADSRGALPKATAHTIAAVAVKG
jgi:hypothetical protein